MLLLLLLSSARAIACANHFFSEGFLVKKDFFGKLIVFHVNMDSKTFFKCYFKRLL